MYMKMYVFYYFNNFSTFFQFKLSFVLNLFSFTQKQQLETVLSEGNSHRYNMAQKWKCLKCISIVFFAKQNSKCQFLFALHFAFCTVTLQLYRMGLYLSIFQLYISES